MHGVYTTCPSWRKLGATDIKRCTMRYRQSPTKGFLSELRVDTLPTLSRSALPTVPPPHLTRIPLPLMGEGEGGGDTTTVYPGRSPREYAYHRETPAYPDSCPPSRTYLTIPPLSPLYPSPIPPPSPPVPSFHILTHPFDVLTRGALTPIPTPSRMNEPQERRRFVDCTGFSLETWAFPCLLAVRCSLFAPVVSS